MTNKSFPISHNEQAADRLLGCGARTGRMYRAAMANNGITEGKIAIILAEVAVAMAEEAAVEAIISRDNSSSEDGEGVALWRHKLFWLNSVRLLGGL